MNTQPVLIQGKNLSESWTKVIEYIVNNPGTEITPLLLTLTDFSETEKVKNALDRSLIESGKASIHTVAETIFPASLYQLYKHSRQDFYEGYLDILPRIKKIEPKNSRGTYFERLIAFNGNVNQVENIITSYSNNPSVRRSKLQASIFDASKDHLDSAYQGFPCLQHLTFYVTSDGGLVVNSFYAIQYIYERAYGNWLGLINLGKFIAQELQIDLVRFNCFVGVEQLDVSKEKVKGILDAIE